MTLNKDTRILIVGLGLMGGSYAKALTRRGYRVSAITKEQSSVDYALREGIIRFMRESQIFHDTAEIKGQCGVADYPIETPACRQVVTVEDVRPADGCGAGGPTFSMGSAWRWRRDGRRVLSMRFCGSIRVGARRSLCPIGKIVPRRIFPSPMPFPCRCANA